MWSEVGGVTEGVGASVDRGQPVTPLIGGSRHPYGLGGHRTDYRTTPALTTAGGVPAPPEVMGGAEAKYPSVAAKQPVALWIAGLV